jgi:hypothetical protein
MKVLILMLTVVSVWMIFPSDLFAQGCSQCRLLTEQGSEIDENSFGSNINTGILYLMIIPYLLLMFLFRKRISTLLGNLRRKQT